MRRLREAASAGPVILLVFGALMAVHSLVSFAFTRAEAITHLLTAGVAAASVLTGLGTLAWRLRRPPDPAAPFVLPDLSMATVLLAAGITALVVGAEAGLWLILVGAGACAIGAGGIVRERRARPR